MVPFLVTHIRHLHLLVVVDAVHGGLAVGNVVVVVDVGREQQTVCGGEHGELSGAAAAQQPGLQICTMKRFNS